MHSNLNIKNFKKLRDHIASLPAKQCDMSIWTTPTSCGMARCIGGWASILAGNNDDPTTVTPRARAAKWLGVTGQDAFNLFYDFPIASRSWRRWMVARLDGIIRNKRVTQYARVKALKGL